MKELILLLPTNSNKIEIPFCEYLVSAGATGFPSPCDDFSESSLDLNEYLKVNKDATFYVKVCGNSMQGYGIDEGDILVVDRSLKPIDGSIIVCLYNSELLVKKLQIEFNKVSLISSNPNYPPVVLNDSGQLIVWGVVKSAVKDFVKEKSKSNVRTGRR